MTSDNSPSRSLVRADASTLPATLGPEFEEAAGYARAEKAEATRWAYKSDFCSSPLLDGYDEQEILRSSSRQICLTSADAGQINAKRIPLGAGLWFTISKRKVPMNRDFLPAHWAAVCPADGEGFWIDQNI